MASVTPVKRVRGYGWRVQARDPAGVMHQETFSGSSAQTVERAARSFAAVSDRLGIIEAIRIRDTRQAGRTKAVTTLSDWIDRYLDVETGILTGVGAGTRERYKRMAAATIKPRLGEMPVDAITSDDVGVWVLWLEAQPGARKGTKISAKTVKNHHALLSQILAEAASPKRKLREGNPARGAKIRRTRKAGMTVLTQTEFATVLAFTPAKWKPFVLWLAGTGMRWGEATALTWGDIDRDERPMLVRITTAWNDDDDEQARVLGPTKTQAGERTISVPDALVRELGAPGPGDAFVFATRTGTALWSGSFWTRVWTPTIDLANDPAACAAAGLTPIGKRPRVHDLRHSHASWLIAAGRPLPYIQRRLGHEKITTTIGTYGRFLPDAMQGDADAIELAMGGVLGAIEAPADEVRQIGA
ncbi:MAG: tyrosine-type recombinase/integrase [Rhodoglobus sp.]